MVKGVKFVSIPVTDQDRALDFYVGRMGLKVVTDQPFDDNQRWIELKIPGSETKVVLFTPDEHRDRIGTFQNVTFWSDDVERTAKELKSKGVEFVQEPTQADWGTTAVFRDADGNIFVLSSK